MANEILITVKADDQASQVLKKLKSELGGLGDQGKETGGAVGKDLSLIHI